MEPLLASIEADLAIAPLLRSTIPHYLAEVGRDARLPPLPRFLINLYLPPARQSDIAVELARHIRQEFAARAHRSSRHRRRVARQRGSTRDRLAPVPGPIGA